jgi:hypothetical protein
VASATAMATNSAEKSRKNLKMKGAVSVVMQLTMNDNLNKRIGYWRK